MSNSWSMKFKRRMMQLETAVKDFETGKIYTINDRTPCEYVGRPIHRDLFDQMNYDRRKNRLPVFDIPDTIVFDDWEGRGFKHKFTGEFMQAEEAGEWASQGGYDSEQYWSGESCALRRVQGRMVEESI